MQTPVECLICKVVSKELKGYIVYEDAVTLAFLDIHPQAPGHTMVVPKEHIATVSELPEALVGPVFQTVRKVAKRLEEVLAVDGLTIGVNQGSAGGQTVPHLHIHLMPRFANDQGGSIHSVVSNPPQESVETLRNKLQF